jgi:thioredoxin 1
MVVDEELERLNKKKAEELIARQQEQQQRRFFEQSQRAQYGRPVVLTDSNFASEVAKHDLLVVDFWAPWCGPCRMVSPIIEQLAKEYAGRVTFGKLNVDENPVVSQAFRIQSIPTLLVFHKGKAVDGQIGALPKAQIEDTFRRYLSGGGGASDPSTSAYRYREIR